MTNKINPLISNETSSGGAPLLPPIKESSRLSEMPPEVVKTAELVKTKPVVEAMQGEFVPVESVGPSKSKGAAIGAGTGVVNTAVLSPIDRLNALRVKEGRNVPFKEVFNRAAFRGLSINLAGNLLNYGTLFGVQPVMASLSSEVFANSVATKMSTGALSGTVQALVSRPFGNTSLQMQMAKDNINALALFRSIPEGQVLSFLYRGVQATVMRNGSHAMVYFPAYDAIMNVFTAGSFDQTHQPNDALKLSMGFSAGGVAGALGTIVSLPLHNMSVIQATSQEKISSLEALKIMCGRGLIAPWQTFVLTSTRMFAASAVAGGVTQAVDMAYKRHSAKKQQAKSQHKLQAVPVQKEPPKQPGLLSRIVNGIAGLFGKKKADPSSSNKSEEPNSSASPETPNPTVSKQAKMITYFFAPEPGPELLDSGSASEDEDEDSQTVSLQISTLPAAYYFTQDIEPEMMSWDTANDSGSDDQDSSSTTSSSSGSSMAENVDDACLELGYDPWK